MEVFKVFSVFGGGGISAVAACPACQCDVSVSKAAAWRVAGRRRERVGTVCECVKCAALYTALHAGGVVAFRGAPRAEVAQARDAGARAPGGAGDGAAASLIADMVTDFTRD